MNLDDLELLKLAAKAAGYEVKMIGPAHEQYLFRIVDGKPQDWEPLDDDGDAFRLQVAVGMIVDTSEPRCVVVRAPLRGVAAEEPLHGPSRDEAAAATRRAIARCAAATITQTTS